MRIRPVSEVMQAHLPRLPPETSVTTIEDKLAIVAKEFLVRHYDVQKMVTVIQPMLPSFGHIMADPDTRRLVITDTVANLIRLERVIEGMDVPLAGQTVTEIIELVHGDASEIAAIVRWLIAGRMGIHVNDITTSSGGGSDGPGGSPGGGRPPGRPPSGNKDQPAGAAVTQVEPSKTPVTLVPHVSRNWIIAVAPAEVIAEIKIWVAQLDKPREVEKDYELYVVEYAEVEDVSQRIQRTIQSLPTAELRDTTHVVPFAQSKKLIVFGSKALARLFPLSNSISVPDGVIFAPCWW